MHTVFEADSDLVVWWSTEVECESALTRRRREGSHSQSEVRRARERLDALASGWREIEPTTAGRALARRLLRVHPLRAADALQLAAVLVAVEDDLEVLELVCLDERLGEAANLEGVRLVL